MLPEWGMVIVLLVLWKAMSKFVRPRHFSQNGIVSNFLQTNYQIAPEEMEVYKLLGDHENIVKHYGGTFRGSQGHASIFMEKCGMCCGSFY